MSELDSIISQVKPSSCRTLPADVYVYCCTRGPAILLLVKNASTVLKLLISAKKEVRICAYPVFFVEVEYFRFVSFRSHFFHSLSQNLCLFEAFCYVMLYVCNPC